MCGIAGILSAQGPGDQIAGRVGRMVERLAHRGPDGEGIHVDGTGRVALGHRRLAILDLSDAGRQPMSSPDGRFWIVFNGEIYNYRALKAALEASGERFLTGTDTEVVLRLYMREGRHSLHRLRGMFAFVVWDARERTAFLARDPLGIKPLYYRISDEGELAFASEIRGLLSGLGGQPVLSPQGVADYLQYGHVREPLTLVEGVRILEAGCSAAWHEGRLEPMSRTWRFPDSQMMEGAGPGARTVRAALLDSLEHHFVSDVPVGLFLSGGMDSTALLALTRKELGKAIATYSIAFEEEAWNEGSLASRTAEHFGAEHHEVLMTAGEGRRLFGEYLGALDHPSIDGFNTYCVSAAAHREGAKVVLSGLGSDELFGGYRLFRQLPVMLRMAELVPGVLSIRAELGRLLESAGGDSRLRRFGDLLMGEVCLPEAYRTFRGMFTGPEVARLTGRICGGSRLSPHAPALPGGSSIAGRLTRMELTWYMRDRLLRDSDAMSMAHSLELRVPFVDRGVVEAILALPEADRMRPGKQLLAEAVPEIPDWITNRPKRGFIFPFQVWLGGEWTDLFRGVRERHGGLVALNTWSRPYLLFVLESWCDRLGIGRAS